MLHSATSRIGWIGLLSPLLLAGCINISTQLQPEDKSVKGTETWSECVPIIFGLGAGTLDVRSSYLARLKTLEYQEFMFLFFGGRCLEATGERATKTN